LIVPGIIHIVPDSITNQKKAFVGSSKDVRGRSDYFRSRHLEIQEYLSVGRSDSAVLNMLRSSDLTACMAVVFEYETYIETLDFLRTHHPDVRRIVRAHNANFPHFLDQFRGRLRMTNGAAAIDDIQLASRRFMQDCACAELADDLLCISEWEARNYWGPLVRPPTRVHTVPYFLPDEVDRQIAHGARRNLCVCFMGTGGGMTPLLYDAGRNTVELVNVLDPVIADQWEFCITGSLKPADVLGPLGRMKPTGLLPSPLPILAEARVVTILSDLGMGFKTKILEAIEAGCWVLVTADLLERLPEAVTPWCKIVEIGSPQSLGEALAACLQPPPAETPNRILRDQAFAALDEVFLQDWALAPSASGISVPLSV
jgi:hypothetical protein